MKGDISRINTKTQGSGSPQSGEPVYIYIGRLRRPHGLLGEISMDLLPDLSVNLKPGMMLFIGEDHQNFCLDSFRIASKSIIVSLQGVDDRGIAERYRNHPVYVYGLPENIYPIGAFSQSEIIGMQVYSETGARLGQVSEILKTGANDVYVVKIDDGSELLIPAIKSVIIKIDRNSNSIQVRPQQWE